MRYVLLATLMIPLVTRASDGPGDHPAPAPGPTPGQELEAILKDHKALLEERDRAIAGARTQEELRIRQEAFGYDRRLEPIARRALDLAREHPEDPAALDALVWVIRRTSHSREAVALLTADQVRDPRVRIVFELIPFSPDPADERLGREVLRKNPSPEVRGEAGQFVVRCLYRQAMLVRRLRLGPKSGNQDDLPFAEADSARLRRSDPEQLIAEADALFARIQREYEVPESFLLELRETAERALFELQHLGIGQPAPEVDGKDLDGKPMRLSDYRGKVVLLSFWGTWCGSCMNLVPEERSLVERLEGKPFVLLGINGDKDREKARIVAERERMTWRSWWDGTPPGPIARAWNITGWPTFYLIDQEGIIRFKCIDYDERGLGETLGHILGDRREGG